MTTKDRSLINNIQDIKLNEKELATMITISDKARRQIIRINAILKKVRDSLESNDETQLIMNLINIDFCNESILRIITSEYKLKSDKSIHTCWEVTDKYLDQNPINGIKSLPNKSEILSLIHGKRNFIQHSGECPIQSDVEYYYSLSNSFVAEIAKLFFEIDIESFSIIDLIRNEGYKKALHFSNQSAISGDFEGAIAVLKNVYETASDITEVISNCNPFNNLAYEFRSKYKRYLSIDRKKIELRLEWLEEIFGLIDNKLYKLSQSIFGVLSNELNLMSSKFIKIPPKDVVMTGDGGIHYRNDSGTKPEYSDYIYCLSFTVNLIIKLEKINILKEFPCSIKYVKNSL
jgi:hypothetical protein